MPTYALLIWIVIGVSCGIFAAPKFFSKHGPFGKVGDIISGILGAVVGGYLPALLIKDASFGLIITLITAFVVAMLFIWLLAKIKK